MPEGKAVGFTDADFALQEHRHSISGYVFLVHEGAASWPSETHRPLEYGGGIVCMYGKGGQVVHVVRLRTLAWRHPGRPFPLLTDNMPALHS